MDQRFWNSDDYKNARMEIEYRTPDGERFPEFRNPETAPVIKKLVDRQNFLVILTDEQLGLQHRSNVASDFFSAYRDLVNLYYVTDRQDKFVYGSELVEILKFGLELQQHYFKLGNENIIKDADDPNSISVRSLIESNEKTLLSNYNNYLDLVNKETSFSESDLVAFSVGLDYYFSKVLEVFPDANFSVTKNKAQLMLNKTTNEDVKTALKELLQRIDTHTESQ